MTDPEKGSDDDPTAAAPVSRTQRKREALYLQSLGAELVALDAGDLARVPLPDDLLEAIATWKRIRSREARRRQLQLIGKLMRRTDVAPITDALERIHGNSARARYEFQQLERWRDRLIDDDASLTEYLSAHPGAERQRLRHQIAKVRRARDEARRRSESRALFRLLRAFEDPHGEPG